MIRDTTKSVICGEAYETLPIPIPYAGLDFEGGYIEANSGGTEITSLTILTTTSNHTLYAKWNN